MQRVKERPNTPAQTWHDERPVHEPPPCQKVSADRRECRLRQNGPAPLRHLVLPCKPFERGTGRETHARAAPTARPSSKATPPCVGDGIGPSALWTMGVCISMDSQPAPLRYAQAINSNQGLVGHRARPGTTTTAQVASWPSPDPPPAQPGPGAQQRAHAAKIKSAAIHTHA